MSMFGRFLVMPHESGRTQRPYNQLRSSYSQGNLIAPIQQGKGRIMSADSWSRSTRYPDMWVDPEEDPRESEGELRGERAILVDYLRSYRLTFRMKCDDLDAAQMSKRPFGPSELSLLGLLRHLTDIERHWFRRVLEGQDISRHFRSEDGTDQAFNGALADVAVVAQAWELWEAEVTHAQQLVDSVDDLATVVEGDDPLEVREVLVHMIEEYARHCGHADLIREAIDGRVGQ
ncbi:mycothiol transferase [Solicola gregarius]|uniref:DinB family protein n=1 Tax=Solicola gregarius TaxID=2908642 RepID=A0AA46TJ98_9ACTN|nr:DUF664 domain-containing protein [Solicola gregarius]UYM06367.1 DinB family protein [Solicola gregarius]